MAVEDILRALEDKAERRIETIKSDARQRVNEIVSEAEREASRTRRLRLKKVEDAIRSECTSMIYSASLRAKNELIKAQEQVVDEAFKLAEKRLSGLRLEKDYPGVFKALVEECMRYLDGEVVFRVREDDRALLEEYARGKGISFSISDEPLESSGGVIASSPDGTIVVNNTFESRLQKAKEKLRLQVSKALFGS